MHKCTQVPAYTHIRRIHTCIHTQASCKKQCRLYAHRQRHAIFYTERDDIERDDIGRDHVFYVEKDHIQRDHVLCVLTDKDMPSSI